MYKVCVSTFSTCTPVTFSSSYSSSSLCLSNKLIVSPGSARGAVQVVANGNRRDFADKV